MNLICEIKNNDNVKQIITTMVRFNKMDRNNGI